jgi:hypothetical protein
MSSNPYNVKPHQVWADNDKRRQGRTLKVNSVETLHAKCEVLTFAPNRQIKRKFVRIRLDRFRPRVNGYSLVRDGDGSLYIASVGVKNTTADSSVSASAVKSYTADTKSNVNMKVPVVSIEDGKVRVTMRRFDSSIMSGGASGLDVKIYINDAMVFSRVFRDSKFDIKDVVLCIESELSSICDSADKILLVDLGR